jgi:hypothetical protein
MRSALNVIVGNREDNEHSKNRGPAIEPIDAGGAVLTAFLYNISVALMGGYILVPAIVFSIVGAAWLIGRAGKALGSWRPRRFAKKRRQSRWRTRERP